MNSQENLPPFLLLMIGVAIASFVYLIYRIITIKKGVYKNALKLEGIPRIEQLRVKDGLSIGAETDEFVHIADTIEEWHLQKKSIVDYIEDEEHRRSLLQDFAYLKKQAEIDLIGKLQRPTDDEAIRRRETFIKNAEIEIARLQGWKPTPKETQTISFREFNAKVICFLSNDGARKTVVHGIIRIFDEGDFIIMQEIIEAGRKIELARLNVTKANAGQEVKLCFDTSGTSRLILQEQRTGRKESRPF